MLYDCNRGKYYSLKYGPLLIGLLITTNIFSLIKSDNPEWWVDLILMIIVAAICVIIFLLVKDKLKLVAISGKKIVIEMDGMEKDYEWPVVEEINLNRFWGLYKLKVPDQDAFYFTAYGFVSWMGGDISEMGDIIVKKKRELNI